MVILEDDEAPHEDQLSPTRAVDEHFHMEHICVDVKGHESNDRNVAGLTPDQKVESIPEISTAEAHGGALHVQQENKISQDVQDPSTWPVRLPVVCFLTKHHLGH